MRGSSAQRGDVNAGIALAACLQNGIGIEEADPKAAYKLYENIANTSHDARAYGALGLACLQGNGCPEDDNLGKAYLDTAVSLGHEASLFYLGACYLSGLGCRADTATAISWLEKAADNENIRAINTLGDIYRQQGELKNAVLYYEKAVTLGSLEGYCNLGYCYQEGLGVVLNSQKAYELYKFAADHEYNRAYRMLASCYTNGIYVEPSMAEALNWLTKAADNGDVIAMYYCGSILEEGDEGVPADKKKAREWYKKAAAQGDASAQLNLGFCYGKGNGVSQSDQDAVFWYKKAAEQGNDKAQYNLGLYYMDGAGVPQSNKEAKYWFRKAAAQGFRDAQIMLEKIK